MRTHTDGTPCPAIPPLGRPRRVSFLPQEQQVRHLIASDNTEDVDFTTELRMSMRNVKPRRRASVMPRAGTGSTFNPGADIWQDVGQEACERENTMANEGGARSARVSLLEKPAMRAPVLARKIAPSERYGHGEQRGVVRTSVLHEASRPKRLSGRFENHTQSLRMLQVPDSRPQSRRTSIMGGAHLPVLQEHERPHPLAQSEHLGAQPRRDARRRTMWVPSDDTTVVTIHPGAQSQIPDDTWRRAKVHDIGLDLVTVSEEEPENEPVQPQESRHRTSLAAKPRKIPLQASKYQRGPNAAIIEDRIGGGGGKENVPPGTEKVLNVQVKTGPADIVIHFDDAHGFPGQKADDRRNSVRPAAQNLGRQQREVPSRKVQQRSSIGVKRNGSSSILQCSPHAKAAKSQHRPATRPWTSSATDWHRDSRYNQPDATTCNIDVHGALRVKSQVKVSEPRVPMAPLIAEDLAHPELYEEHWLAHQEIAITQVLNELLSQDKAKAQGMPDYPALRRRMLRLYQDAGSVALMKRLQASLQYGALALPADLLPKVARLGNDIGMRRNFLDLWLKTYHHDVLRAALEAIVGRELVLPKRLSGASQTLTDNELEYRLAKRGIERYLQAYLIGHEDASPASGPPSSIASIARHVDSNGQGERGSSWRWRRTMLRSLMLILLLDRAKSLGAVTTCVFRKASEHKSSSSVLQALSSMLLPSAGDVGRSLGHLHYRLHIVQHPLEEYEYAVENIAVDLRDGITLARIAELLHFKPNIETSQADATMTVALPSGEVLESLLNDQSTNRWLLSQHLKFPCIGRAQKLHNVQISLSALAGVKGVPARILTSISAEQVVDGHREKTMGLLWGLVGQAGLEILADSASLMKELRRLSSAHSDPTDEDGEEDNRAEQSHARLLQQWATTVARRHNVTITNLTTSFADGRAFRAIVAEYAPSIPTSNRADPSSMHQPCSSGPRTLAASLKAIGCSHSFVSLFTQTMPDGTISCPFSRSFILLTLSYLASRLLPLTAAHRAVVILQRWYRNRLVRQQASQRVRLLRLAHDCATVVNTRNDVVSAALSIQRAWRRVLERKRAVLNRDAALLQALIKGWRVRNILCRPSGHCHARAKAGWRLIDE